MNQDSKPRPFKFFAVPAGTAESTCDAHRRGGTCRAPIYWLTYNRPDPKVGTKRVRNPIDCAVVGGRAPAGLVGGLGVSHYQTCPDAALFGKEEVGAVSCTPDRHPPPLPLSVALSIVAQEREKRAQRAAAELVELRAATSAALASPASHAVYRGLHRRDQSHRLRPMNVFERKPD